MLRLRLFIMLVFLSLASARAQNLVEDGAFEVIDTCPSVVGQIDCQFMTMPFPRTLTTWYNPNINTPDYFNVCALDSFLLVPNTFVGFQQPHSGAGFTGFLMYVKGKTESWSNNYREYIQTKLTEPLVAGKNYRISYFVSFAFEKPTRNWVALKEFQASLTTTPPQSMGLPLTSAYTKLRSASGDYVTDSAGWTEVVGNYRATGGEQWLTLGMFFDGTVPDALHVIPKEPVAWDGVSCYYFVDDVSVIPCDTTTSTHDTLLPCFASVSLKGEPLHEHMWDNGATTDSINVSENGIYWCMSTSGCMAKVDTFHVKVKQPVLNDKIDIGRDTTVCSSDKLIIGMPLQGVRYSWSTGETACCISPSRSGIYTVTVDDGCITVSDSMHVQLLKCDDCLVIPSAFTPNADGLNDVFRVLNRCDLQFFHLQIFNRWGERMFETNSINDKWEGTYRQQPAELGTYFYAIQFNVHNRAPQYIKGDITLIK